MTDGHALDLAFLAWLRTATIEDLIRARDDCAIDWKWHAIRREIARRPAVSGHEGDR